MEEKKTKKEKKNQMNMYGKGNKCYWDLEE